MKDNLEITFQVCVPETQFESVMNTLILEIRDYKIFMEEGRQLLNYDDYKDRNNLIIEKMINNLKNLYE